MPPWYPYHPYYKVINSGKSTITSLSDNTSLGSLGVLEDARFTVYDDEREAIVTFVSMAVYKGNQTRQTEFK